MSVVGYPVPHKAKASMLVTALCEGAGGRVCKAVPRNLAPGDAMFYGITAELHHLWTQAKREGRNVYNIDNALIDSCRETFFRVAKNRMQPRGVGAGSPSRFAKLNVPISPWRKSGSFILLCPQSTKFMQLMAGRSDDWAATTSAELRKYTDREIVANGWQRDKARFYEALPAKLKDCWALVTWSSAAAHTATFLGVPAFVMSEDAIARRWLNTDLARIESPSCEVDREAFGAMLAKWQFTIAELRSGYAWNVVNGDE